jgi:hypothetical protein
MDGCAAASHLIVVLPTLVEVLLLGPPAWQPPLGIGAGDANLPVPIV